MPLVELPYTSAPELIAERLSSGLAPMLLHSAPEAGGSRSYLGIGPLATLEWWSPARWEASGWQPADSQLASSPLRMLEGFAADTAQAYGFSGERVNRFPFPTPFFSGLVGFLSYELGEYILPKLDRRPPTNVPLLGFWRHSLLYVAHHRLRKAFAWWPSSEKSTQKKIREEAMEALRKVLREHNASPDSNSICDSSGQCLRVALESGEATSSLPFGAYSRAFNLGQELIRAGDVYQFNLTHQISFPFDGSPWSAFHRLMRTNPAARAASIVCPDYAILSASPERLVERRGRIVCTSPIKGTRLRIGIASADRRARAELRQSAKDLAEHVMIVDLERNDLGRVCEYGSVRATPMFSVQTLPSLYHLVSTVKGRLRKQTTVSDLLAAIFPGGSITGAPKLRSLQVLQLLEPVARGIYTGAIGWLGDNADLFFNVAIRTITLSGGRAQFGVGGGIVADSRLEDEWDEGLAKGERLAQALTRDDRM